MKLRIVAPVVVVIVLVIAVAAFVWPRSGGAHTPRVLTRASLARGELHAADFNDIAGMPHVADQITTERVGVQEWPSRGPCGTPTANPVPPTQASAAVAVGGADGRLILDVAQVDPAQFDAFMAATRADMHDNCPAFVDTTLGDASTIVYQDEIPLSLDKSRAVAVTGQVTQDGDEVQVTAIIVRNGDVAAALAWGGVTLSDITVNALARRLERQLGQV